MNEATITIEHQGQEATIFYAWEDRLDEGMIRIDAPVALEAMIWRELRAAPSVMTPYGIRQGPSSWHFLRKALARWAVDVRPPADVKLPKTKPDRIY